MAAKLRDRGNLSTDQQSKIRSMLAEGKSPDAIATEMNYLPKYLSGRIAKHGLDKPTAGAPVAVKPTAKPKTPTKTKQTKATKPPLPMNGLPPAIANVLGSYIAERSNFQTIIYLDSTIAELMELIVKLKKTRDALAADGKNKH